MKSYTRLGVICDMHLQNFKESPQLAFLRLAASKMKENDVDVVLCLGDITGFGDVGAWDLYMDALKDVTHYEVLGNSDVRDASTREILANRVTDVAFPVGDRMVYGLNTPDGIITPNDRARLASIKDGDVIFMHHYMNTLDEDSQDFLTKLATNVSVTILHGHGHRIFDYDLEKSHVYGMRGLDPDKAIGDFPTIVFVDVYENEIKVEEIPMKLPKSYFLEVQKLFGISCVDNHRDVKYALENDVKHIELRCNGKDWYPDETLIPLIEEWRKKTNGYLSIHMPNLKYADGVFGGFEQWQSALEYGVKLDADSYTMHPPRVRVCDMPVGGEVWNTFLEPYLNVTKLAKETARMGVENIHKSQGEAEDETRGFGYIPSEICAWIDEINEKVGFKRVGHVLDVGHARNNGGFAKEYPISRWYCLMGNRTIAYHIHQVIAIPGAYKNHNPIENWFGPMINYAAFIYAMNIGIINKVPVFLEVKGADNYQKSVDAFAAIVDSLED